MKHGIVARNHKSLFPYQAWPTVVCDEDGVLYVGCAGYKLGHWCPMGKNLLYVSRNGGETWSVPRVVADDVMDNRDVGLTYLGGKKILLSSFCKTTDFYLAEGMREHVKNHPSKLRRDVTEGVYHVWENTPKEKLGSGSYVILSEDGGETWGEKTCVPVSSPHGPIRLASGKLLYLGKEFYTGQPDFGGGRIMTYESEDDGRTWSYLGTLETPDGCTLSELSEPYPLELPDGTILGMIRAEGPTLPFTFTLFTCTSQDGGKTWTKPVCLNTCGAPPHLFRHSSGAIILTYGRRHNGPSGVRARISRDNGQTFGEEILLGKEIDYWDLGYPSTAELPDGTLITTYYQRYEEDSFNSILYTKWSLDEVGI